MDASFLRGRGFAARTDQTHRICDVSAQTPTTRRRPAKTTADRARRTAGKAADGSRTARKDDPQPKVAARRSTCLVN